MQPDIDEVRPAAGNASRGRTSGIGGNARDVIVFHQDIRIALEPCSVTRLATNRSYGSVSQGTEEIGCRIGFERKTWRKLNKDRTKLQPKFGDLIDKAAYQSLSTDQSVLVRNRLR